MEGPTASCLHMYLCQPPAESVRIRIHDAENKCKDLSARKSDGVRYADVLGEIARANDKGTRLSELRAAVCLGGVVNPSIKDRDKVSQWIAEFHEAETEGERSEDDDNQGYGYVLF